MSEFSLRPYLSETLESLQAQARQKGLDLNNVVKLEVTERLIGDPARLGQILMSLIGNAIKFTDQGEIRLEVVTGRQGSGDCELLFTVADTGIGIPKEKQKLIFEAFSQADGSSTRAHGGTGLGLAVASRLVQMMQGHIWVDSEAGQGSRFHFTARFGTVVQAAEVRGQECLAGALRG
jgi:signal transduction histidine kinase